MLVDQQFLRIPGPTPIPPTVQRAMTKPMIPHRSAATSAIIEKARPRLQKIFGTSEEVAIIAGSGTSAMETAFLNIVHPDDEVLVSVTGTFGERFYDICKSHIDKVHRINSENGKPITPEEIQNYLKEHPSISAVFLTHSETATGVLNPIKDIAKAVKEVSDALVVIDGVSSIGGVEMKMDDWGIDVVATGSQKAFMMPPGLAFVAAGKRAWEKIESGTCPTYYFSLKSYRDNLHENTTPFTPASSLLYGLDAVLDLIDEEGLENVYKRHQIMMDMTRAAMKALDIPLLAEEGYSSPTITAIIPDAFDASDYLKVLEDEFNLILAGGLQDLTGKILRIGHMGYCSPSDILLTIGAMELGLQRMGQKVEPGVGTAAAQKVYLEATKK